MVKKYEHLAIFGEPFLQRISRFWENLYQIVGARSDVEHGVICREAASLLQSHCVGK